MRIFIKENWKYLIGVFFIFSVFLLRLLNLTEIPVFADEAIYIRWAQVMRAEQTLRFLPLSDGKQPLFMWLVIPFFKIVSDPLMAGRLVSVLSGFGTLLGVIVLSYLILKNKMVAVLSGIFYTISPFIFFFDRLALADSLLSMFGVWTFIFTFLAIKRQRSDLAMIAGFTLGGAWLTKSPALFFTLMLPTLLIFVNWKKNFRENILVLFRNLYYLIWIILIGYGMYNILRLGPNFHLIASRNMDYIYPLSHIFDRPLDPLKTFLIASFKWIWSMGTLSLIVLPIISIVVNFRKYPREIFVLLIWFLVPIFVQCEFAKTLTARYILYPLPYLIILAASVLVNQSKIIKNLAIFFIGLFVFQSSIFIYHLITNPAKANLPRVERSGYLEEWTAGQGIKETADYLIKFQNENPKTKIVIGTEGYFGTLPDGLQMYLNNYPSITAIGVGLTFGEVPKPLAESFIYGNSTYLLVNSSRFGDYSKRQGLKLIKEYPKAIKPDGTYDSLLFFEITGKTFKNEISYRDKI